MCDLFVCHPSVCLYAWCPKCDASLFVCLVSQVRRVCLHDYLSYISCPFAICLFMFLSTWNSSVFLSCYLFSCHRYMHLSVDMFTCRLCDSFVRRCLSVRFPVKHVRSICLFIGQIYCTSFRWHQKVEGGKGGGANDYKCPGTRPVLKNNIYGIVEGLEGSASAGPQALIGFGLVVCTRTPTKDHCGLHRGSTRPQALLGGGGGGGPVRCLVGIYWKRSTPTVRFLEP